MTDKNGAPATAAAFLLALDSIRDAIKDLQGWDACLALTICLSECVVYGNSDDDDPDDEALRLANTIRVLGDITTDMMAGDEDGDDDGDDALRPSPPSADLLRKFLEHRRATKTGG